MNDPYFPDAPKVKEKKKISRGGVFLRIIVAMVIAVGISLGVLSMLGGNSATLREGLEGYLSQSTGFDVRIGTINDISFFPILNIDVADVRMHAPAPGMVIDVGRVRAPSAMDDQSAVQQKSIPGRVVAEIGRVHLAIAFLDVLMSRARYRALDVSGVHLGPEFTGYAPLVLDKIGVSQDGDDAMLSAVGRYGDDAVMVNFTMANDGTDKTPIWKLRKDGDVTARMGPIEMVGRFDRHVFATNTMTIDRFGVGNGSMWNGTLVLSRHKDGLKISGALKSGVTTISPDLVLQKIVVQAAEADSPEDSHMQLRGTIGVDNFFKDDYAPLYTALVTRARPQPNGAAFKSPSAFWNDVMDHVMVVNAGDQLVSLRDSVLIIADESPKE